MVCSNNCIKSRRCIKILLLLCSICLMAFSGYLIFVAGSSMYLASSCEFMEDFLNSDKQNSKLLLDKFTINENVK